MNKTKIFLFVLSILFLSFLIPLVSSVGYTTCSGTCYQIGPGENTGSGLVINSVCWKITNNHASNNYFVPLNSAAESQAFVDNLPEGVTKTSCQTTSTTTCLAQCAKEGGTCSFSGTQAVYYGVDGYFYVKIFTSTTACTNAVFGDPKPGTKKFCYIATACTGVGGSPSSGQTAVTYADQSSGAISTQGGALTPGQVEIYSPPASPITISAGTEGIEQYPGEFELADAEGNTESSTSGSSGGSSGSGWSSEAESAFTAGEADSASGEGSSSSSSSSSSGSGGGGSSGGGKLICTELYKQGLMEESIYLADQEFGKYMKETHPEIMKGYTNFAIPVVEKMKESESFTNAVNVVVKPWSEEMAYKAGVKESGNFVGAMIMNIGMIIFWITGSLALGKIGMLFITQITIALFVVSMVYLNKNRRR